MSRFSLPNSLLERLHVWAGTDAIAHGTYGVRVELASAVISEGGSGLVLGLRVLVLEPFPGRAPVPDSDARVLVGDSEFDVEELGWVTAQGFATRVRFPGRGVPGDHR